MKENEIKDTQINCKNEYLFDWNLIIIKQM